jgi:glutamate synthase domain-containing protein 3
LGDWTRAARTFVKVMPRDYRRAVIGASDRGLAEVANG